MDSYEIIRLGNPLLRNVAKKIEENDFGSAQLKHIESLLFKAMEKEQGIGIAAPQIGISQQILVFGMREHPVYKEIASIPLTILINPSFEPLSDEEEEAYEGCLSVGDLRGKVPRYRHIGYRGYDTDGNVIEREVYGLHARVVQHEFDHLQGVLFVDRVNDPLSFGFHKELIDAGIFPSQLND